MKTITDLQQQLTAINSQRQVNRSTREDIAYLTDLLNCAKKKLAWEKNIASVQKRSALVLEEMSQLINDPKNPPPDHRREAMLRELRSVQVAMERLQSVKLE